MVVLSLSGKIMHFSCVKDALKLHEISPNLIIDDVIVTSYFGLEIFFRSLLHPPIDYLSDVLTTKAVSIMVLEI